MSSHETVRKPVSLRPVTNEHGLESRETEIALVRVERGITALPKNPLGSRWPRAHRVEFPVDVLAHMGENDSLSIGFRIEPVIFPRLRLTYESFHESGDSTSVGRRLAQLLLVAFPGVRSEPLARCRPESLPYRSVLAPERFDLVKLRPATPVRLVEPVATIRSSCFLPLFSDHTRFRLDISAALQGLLPIAPAELQVRVRTLAFDVHRREHLQRSLEHMYALNYRAGERSGDTYTPYLALLRDLLAVRCALRLDVDVLTAVAPDSQMLDTLCVALFGTLRDRQAPEDASLDLRSVWPLGWQMPKLLPSAEEFDGLCTAPQITKPPRDGDLALGESASGAPLRLSARDRARHLFCIGATGTGKTTFILRLFQQQVSGSGSDSVILLDPHGDLAEDARRLVPSSREDHLIWADAADENGLFRLNPLKGHGSNPAGQQNFVANGLIRLLSRVLYPGVQEAFGPMFELYFRNALFLLMDAGGSDATLANFERIFADKAYRRQLVSECHDEKVVEFWRGIAEAVTNDDYSLNNIAPYIVCKLAQFTGNPLMRRLVCSGEPPLDFLAAMNSGKIVILRMPKGALGATDTELLAALTIQSIAQAAMARVSVPAEKRRPVHLYIDEFQTCAGGGLAEMLAEGRKFGLSLVLANQSLSQVNGAGRLPDTGAAALANCANLIAFRVGAADAHRLAPWFAPDVEWPTLCRLPDFHAIVRVLDNGKPQPATLLRTFLPE